MIRATEDTKTRAACGTVIARCASKKAAPPKTASEAVAARSVASPAAATASALSPSTRSRNAGNGCGFVLFSHISSFFRRDSILARNTKSKRRAANAAKDSPRASSTENARASTASSSSRSLVPSLRAANRRGKSRSVAYATQCTGFSGVSRRVHMGCDLGVGLGEHSKHALTPLPS